MKKNIEKLFISKIIGELDYSIVLSSKINSSFFFIKEERAVFRLIEQYYDKYEKVPSENYIKHYFPSYEFSYPKEEFEALAEIIIQNKFNDDYSSLTRKIMDVKREAPLEERIEILREGTKILSDYHTKKRGVINLKESTDNILAEYRKGAEWGLPLPWPTIYEHTLGLVPGEIFLLYGRPGTMKTFLMCKVVEELAYSEYSGVFFSREMPAKTIRRRIICCRAGVDYERYIRRRLTQDEENRFIEAANQLKEINNFYIFDTSNAGTTISSMRSILSQFKDLDVFLNDGIYLMLDEISGLPGSNWQALANIVFGVKELAIDFSLPGMQTSQETRASEAGKVGERSLAGIAFGDALGQTHDIAGKLMLNEDQNHIKYLATKIREGKMRDPVYINAYPCEDLSEKKMGKYAAYLR